MGRQLRASGSRHIGRGGTTDGVAEEGRQRKGRLSARGPGTTHSKTDLCVYVLHVPPPVVLGHVSEGGVDTSLGGDRVRSSREQLGDASGVESSLGESEGSCITVQSEGNEISARPVKVGTIEREEVKRTSKTGSSSSAEGSQGGSRCGKLDWRGSGRSREARVMLTRRRHRIPEGEREQARRAESARELDHRTGGRRSDRPHPFDSSAQPTAEQQGRPELPDVQARGYETSTTAEGTLAGTRGET